VPLERVVTRLGDFAPALRSMGGGLTISGGEPLVQPAFTRRIFGAAKGYGLHTALDTSGYLGTRASDEYLRSVDLVLLDIKSWDLETYRRVTRWMWHRPCASPSASPRWQAGVGALRARAGPDRRPGEREGVARFVAPMTNVEWVEVLPFHQLGAFKWKELGLEYQLGEPRRTARPHRAGARPVPRCGLQRPVDI